MSIWVDGVKELQKEIRRLDDELTLCRQRNQVLLGALEGLLEHCKCDCIDHCAWERAEVVIMSAKGEL